jgi:hypothetical protein
MSARYPGGFITKTPTAPTSLAAPGIWTLDQATQYIKAGTWPSPPPAIAYWIGRSTNASATQFLGNGIVQDTSGNTYTAGYLTITNLTIFLIKFNSAGVIQWQRNLTGSGNCFGWDLAIDSSNNIYVSGISTNTNQEGVVAKYNSSGTLQWQKKIGTGGLSSDFRGIAVDSSSNSYGVGYANSRAQIVKYNTSGTLQWQRKLNEVSAWYGAQVDSTAANVYVGGYYQTGADDFGLIAKIDNSGTLQWQRSLGTAGRYTSIRGLVLDSSDNVYVVGRSGVGFGAESIIIAKYNSSGTIQWQRSLNSANADLGNSIAVDSSGNSYIGAYQTGTNEVMILAKYNSSGTIQWQRSISSSGIDVAAGSNGGVSLDSSLTLYVNGYTTQGGSYTQFFCKLPNDGSLTGTYSLSGTNYVYAASSLTDAAGTLTDAAGTLTEATTTFTDTTDTLTDATTSSVTTITNL